MKRDTVEQYKYGIRKIWPLLNWVKCCKCNKEFRREPGWQFVTEPFRNHKGVVRQVCCQCVPTRTEAHQLAINTEWWPKQKPPPSPPPPPKRVIREDVTLFGRRRQYKYE